MSDVWLTQSAAQVAVQRALTQTTAPTVRHGTVVTVDNGLFVHEVLMDADTIANVTIRAHDITYMGVSKGQRVSVLFAPPHQALIIGSPVHDYWHIVGNNGEAGWFPGWGHDSSSGGLDSAFYPKVMFRKDGNWVMVRGTAVRSSGAFNQIFTLPVGYRPRNNLLLNALTSLAGHTVVQINTNGEVTSQAGTTPILFHDVFFSIL